MKLYAAIDLHSINNVTVVIDEQDRAVYQKRLPNDLALIAKELTVYQSEPQREKLTNPCGTNSGPTTKFRDTE